MTKMSIISKRLNWTILFFFLSSLLSWQSLYKRKFQRSRFVRKNVTLRSLPGELVCQSSLCYQKKKKLSVFYFMLFTGIRQFIHKYLAFRYSVLAIVFVIIGQKRSHIFFQIRKEMLICITICSVDESRALTYTGKSGTGRD